MNPSSFSIKGHVGITFKQRRDNMAALTLWGIISKVWSLYPEKITMYFSASRSGADKTEVEDPLIATAIQKMMSGCLKMYNTKCSVGRSVSLFLGDCYKHSLSFGTTSKDTGHETIILTLPFPMKGCYTVNAEVSNYFKKDGIKEHYMMSINIEAYIGDMDQEGYTTAISQGICVYPFMLEHPEMFSDNRASDSETSSDVGNPSRPRGHSTGVMPKKKKMRLSVRGLKPYTSGKAAGAKKVLNALRLAGNKIYEEYTTTDGEDGTDKDLRSDAQQHQSQHETNTAPA
ncbi:matrix protein [Bacopa monnieri virus 2]|uniref:Matrix protein n=1 Tax=Bacopa monnieri virus 2 TaxID=2813288 RepID=A0AAD2KQ25_9RHAB|nr:matrix protein [Bacopa monnieri virus 2]DAF42452.1 TPA_asm: matrix protein [Bacopa monnieri virus 2]